MLRAAAWPIASFPEGSADWRRLDTSLDGKVQAPDWLRLMRVPSVAELHYISGGVSRLSDIKDEGDDREGAIFLRVTSKKFPVIRREIPVNATREFSSERTVNTGVDHPGGHKKGPNLRICPVNSRKFGAETGSYLTTPTASRLTETKNPAK